MLRELRIGLCADGDGDGDAGWRRVLDQELLPWREADGPDFPIVLFSGSIPSWCEKFVRDGGIAVVSGMPRADEILGPSIAAVVHGFRTPDSDRFCRMPGLARLFRGEGVGEYRLHENRKARNGHLADVFPAVVLRPHGTGWWIASGLPLATSLAAAGDCLRRFAGPLATTERVASVDKADIADTLVWMLREAFARRGLPYVRACRFPDAARSVFILRIDVDGLFGTRCRDIAEIASAHGIEASFYFNAALCRAHPGDLSPDWLASHEIGHHADTHDLFDTVEENRRNLLSGMDWVEESLGVRPARFVAPRGLWNDALGTALHDLGHTYSSDFGLDFDSLPFMTPQGILQVPVHPFSPERDAIFHEDEGWGAPSEEAALAAYLAAMERQSRLRRPVHLYGHPELLGRMARTVLPVVFWRREELGLPAMTLGAFADWWLKRTEASMHFAIDEETNRLHVETEGGFPFEAWSARGDALGLPGGRIETLPAGTWSTIRSGER